MSSCCVCLLLLVMFYNCFSVLRCCFCFCCWCWCWWWWRWLSSCCCRLSMMLLLFLVIFTVYQLLHSSVGLCFELLMILSYYIYPGYGKNVFFGFIWGSNPGPPAREPSTLPLDIVNVIYSLALLLLLSVILRYHCLMTCHLCKSIIVICNS